MKFNRKDHKNQMVRNKLKVKDRYKKLSEPPATTPVAPTTTVAPVPPEIEGKRIIEAEKKIIEAE